MIGIVIRVITSSTTYIFMWLFEKALVKYKFYNMMVFNIY